MEEKILTEKQKYKKEENRRRYLKYRDKILQKSREYATCKVCGKKYKFFVKTMHDKTVYHNLIKEITDILTNTRIVNIII